MNIDVKLKTYEQLQFEITKLNTDIFLKDKEIERLKNGYCELKEKCNNGECDCTNEEYDGMAERNMKLSLEVERLNNIIKNLDKMFEYYFIGNKKYDENTVNTIYIKYIKLKELKESVK